MRTGMVMRTLAIVMCGLRAALSAAGDEKKPVDVICPLDGHAFQAFDVTSEDYRHAWGGLDRDFCKHAFKTTPLECLAWVCPACGFAGVKADFDAKNALTDEQKKALLGKLQPAVPLRKGMKQDAVPGHAKFDLLAQAAILKGSPPERAGLAYLTASWCARQQGVVTLDSFDEWLEIRQSHSLEILPLDLKDKNRTDLELDVARRIEKKIEERREQEKRDVEIVKDADAQIASEKAKAQPDAARIKEQERRRGDARGRLHYTNLLKYTALYLYRRHGESPDALRWIADLAKVKGDNSVLDEAVDKTAKSIELERSYQKKALEQYEKAVADGKLEKKAEAQTQYLLGELQRRLGEKQKAAEWYRKALAEPSMKKLAEEQLKLVE